jgi:adenosine deaminase
MEREKIKLFKHSDLHTHIGASVPSYNLFEQAKEEGIQLPNNIKSFNDFEESLKVLKREKHETYLNRFGLIQFLQSSPIAIEKSMFHAVSSAYRNSNITTLELRMNPMLRSRSRGTNYDIDSIIQYSIMGILKAVMVYNEVKAGIIIEIDRTFTEEMAIIVAEKAVKHSKNGTIIGFDMSGFVPKNFKIESFFEPFKIAKDGGLGITIHTGEITGPEEIWKILENIKIDRIGHGVKCIDDKNLMNEISKRNIILELCPTSNLRLGIIKDVKELNKIIRTFKDYGIKFCINSDGPEFLKQSVVNEFEFLYDNNILNYKEIEQIITESHHYSFIK